MAEAREKIKEVQSNNAPTLLYYIRFYDENEEFWKIGITTRTLKERFGNKSVFKLRHGLDFEVISEETLPLKKNKKY